MVVESIDSVTLSLIVAFSVSDEPAIVVVSVKLVVLVLGSVTLVVVVRGAEQFCTIT